MSASKPAPGPFGSWADAAAEGYVAVVLKGSPWTSHAKKPGELRSACGKQPGKKSPWSSHRNRTGWSMYTDGREPTCEKCRAAITKIAGGAT